MFIGSRFRSHCNSFTICSLLIPRSLTRSLSRPDPVDDALTSFTATAPTATLTCGGLNCGLGCTPSSDVTSGNISDGTGNYANNADCWWLLATSPGVEIQISFPSFDTESGFDYVTIYQCISASCSLQTQILRQSGFLSASNVYTSTTGFLKVTFTSDGSVVRSGFIGTWSLKSRPCAATAPPID